MTPKTWWQRRRHEATLCLCHWDGRRRRIVVAYVGEDGIEPGIAYRLDAEGRFAPAP